MGADVSFLRSEKTADDFATTMDVLKEVVQVFENNGKTFENICCLYTTAVFTKASDLQEGLEVLSGGFDSIFSVSEFDFPIQRGFKILDSSIKFLYPEYANTRSQDIEKTVHDAGQFYWIKTSTVKESQSIMTDHTGFYELKGYFAKTSIQVKTGILQNLNLNTYQKKA